MYKDMIVWADMAMKLSKTWFSEEERQFILFYAYKTGDLAKSKLLISDLQHASEPGEKDNIFQRYSKDMDMKSGITQVAETLLVLIERYRLEQENAIGYLSHTLRQNGIQITEEEIRSTEFTALRDKIEKEATR